MLALAGPVGAAAAQEASADQADRILHELLSLDVSELAGRLAAMRAEAQTLRDAAAALRARAETIDEERKAIDAVLVPLAMPAAPESPDAMAAGADDVFTFADNIVPIVEKRCIRCHRQDKREGGLSLATFLNAMDGGSSGFVVQPGDPDGSRLLRLVMKIEEPYMPPKGKPLTAEQVASIRAWIQGGAREDVQSKVRTAKKTALAAPSEIFIAAKIHDGPPPMPEAPLAAASPGTPRAVVARAIATSPTAPLVAVAGDRQIVLYDLAGLKPLGVLPFPEGDVYTMVFSLNGELLLAAGGHEGDTASAVAWNVRKAERVGSYGRGYDTILAADISPDHRMIALGGPDRKVRVYRAAGGDLLYQLDSHTDWVYSVRFSPDGELLASADRAGNLASWQAANGRPVETLRGHVGAIHDLAYTHDSNVLASAGADGQVILWDTWKYRQIRRISAHSGGVLSVHFSKENHLLTSGRDGLSKRWQLDGKAVATYESLGDWAYQARYGNGGALVVAGSWTGDIAVWKSDSGERVSTFTTNPAPGNGDMIVAAQTGR